MISLESLNWPYYYKVTFSQKQSGFVDMIWKFELLLLSLAQMFTKVPQI